MVKDAVYDMVTLSVRGLIGLSFGETVNNTINMCVEHSMPLVEAQHNIGKFHIARDLALLQSTIHY